jgi:DNA invertase Pin-like site-specific DNA recombinase
MKETLHCYRRVSSSIQSTDGDSLSTQLQLAKEQAKRLGMKLQDWNEGAISSAHEDITKRPVMVRLINAMDEGEVKHLYAFHTDRLSRNEATWFLIRSKIKDNEVILHTQAGQLDLNSPQDNFISKIMGAHAEYENQIRRMRSVIGRENSIRKGKFTGGKPNFGYKSVEKEYAIDKDQAKWVRKIYKLFSEGKSLKDIAGILETNGVQPPRASRWNLLSLDNLLSNKIYIGRHMWKGIPVETPQIITHSMFDRVQKRKGERESHYRNPNNDHFYLLGGLLSCASCGSRLWGQIKVNKGSRLYVCPSKNNNWRGLPKTKCKNTKNINLDRTNELVWETVLETVGSSHFMKEKFKKEVLLKKNETTKPKNHEIKLLDVKMRKLKSLESRTLDSIATVEVERLQERMEIETYQLTKDRLVQELGRVRKDIAKIEDEISIKNEEQRWVSWVSRFGISIEKKTTYTEEEKRDYLIQVISKIVVHQTENKEGHILEIFFSQPIVKDRLKYDDPSDKRKGYKVIKGSKNKEVSIKPKKGGRPKKTPPVELIQQ